MTGDPSAAVWPTAMMPRDKRTDPIVSWFAPSLSSLTPESWIEAIDNELVADLTAGSSDLIRVLMNRVSNTHVFDHIHRLNCCPHVLQTPTDKVRVMLIDEPSSVDGIDLSSTQRKARFRQMVEVARETHPDAEFWLAQSAASGHGRWLSSSTTHLPHGLRRLSRDDSLGASLSHFDHVYTVSAPEGMQALLSRVPLHVFGMPYYAGWGLTDDYNQQPDRAARPTLAALFEVVFTRLAFHLDPATHSPGSLDALLDSIDLQRAVVRRFSHLRHVVGISFQQWKRPFVTPFLRAGGGSLRWTHHPETLNANECAALWGARNADALPKGSTYVRIEDGFIHSTGLGSDMNAPYSQVIDSCGLHFDPTAPSDLTAILNETDFDDIELARAAALRVEIVRSGLTKYNLGRRAPTWRPPVGRTIVLVAGQVADDASVLLGTKTIRTAEQLLQEVRARRTDAFIVYKPHPDVMSGNRNGLIDAARFADIVDTEADMISLIEAATEVHTLSSLAGFDALLRDKAVYTYGLPFYAGWGLTHDEQAPLPWRQRTLTIDMLIAGALLRYPIYWDWRLSLYTTPEAVVRQLKHKASRQLKRIREDPTRPFLKAFRWSRNALSHIAWRYRQYREKSLEAVREN
ncbi:MULTISPECIES: capsular polysaccharide export protein, LipB/KpsS family [Burkholderia]|uniref:capsular polysaccharide export protein, LipB/KpsS family n=1 Tax=Burkholderia TaxID=32008 RepID=UPI001CF46BE1|nr:capsular biosynthesis protein [Burkholderia cepacia]MCA7893328.1 capsular biosynthesis protein [Burkholderia cepacia]MCA8059696.1 capsular biosynthesis protein [Burkholderia cepacia]MCA8137057.1 capsular biosynthesis protein [Burkholderia cepacia]HEM7888628.1 capsular biosynthesis protein [Burkholderia cepacia]HEM8508959.1 capsular biosynthesis protein [Burkholderia cepacia]